MEFDVSFRVPLRHLAEVVSSAEKLGIEAAVVAVEHRAARAKPRIPRPPLPPKDALTHRSVRAALYVMRTKPEAAWDVADIGRDMEVFGYVSSTSSSTTSHLVRAGLATRPGRGKCQLTQAGIDFEFDITGLQGGAVSHG